MQRPAKEKKTPNMQRAGRSIPVWGTKFVEVPRTEDKPVDKDEDAFRNIIGATISIPI